MSSQAFTVTRFRIHENWSQGRLQFSSIPMTDFLKLGLRFLETVGLRGDKSLCGVRKERGRGKERGRKKGRNY